MEQEIKRNIPRDLFLHLLAIVTLYWSAISFVTLLWQYVNYFFPDALDKYYNYSGFTVPIRFAVSSLIIVFPVFILVSRYLNKIYARELAVRESKIRKWLIYLTLFVASLVIIGDLIAVINIFLGGEITVRFILKALSVLIVAGFVFGYYLDDVRRETPAESGKYFAFGSGFLVLIAVIGAFFIVGSPITARLMQFDEQKIGDLQNIQSQIVSYWQRKEFLPETAEDLNDPISNYMIPKDPQTDQNYEYSIRNAENLEFELCANFNKEGGSQYDTVYYRQTPAGYTTPDISKGKNDSWQHPAGRFCFERTIDRQLYPPLNKAKQ